MPDLGVPVPAGSPVLVDWKTGHAGDALLQLALYAYYARERLRLPPGPLGYVGRVGDLGGADGPALGGEVLCVGQFDGGGHGLGVRGGIGGAVFVVSDSLIALNTFDVLTLPAHEVWVMATYVAAQVLLVLGVMGDRARE